MLANNSLELTSAASDQILYVSLGKVSPNGMDALSQAMGGCRHMFHHINSETMWPHTCSKMFMSGDMLDHGKTLTAAFCRKAVVSLAVCGGALCCWMMGLLAKACPSMCGSSQGTSTSSRYLAAVKLSWTSTNGSLQVKFTENITDFIL